MFSFVKELKTASLSILLILLLLGFDFLFHDEITLNNIEIVLIGLAIQIPLTTFLLVKMRSITDESSRMRRAIKNSTSTGLCVSTSFTLIKILESPYLDLDVILTTFFPMLITFMAVNYFFDFTPISKQTKTNS